MQFELIRGISQLSSKHAPSVVSIGNYDGVHLGHQQVIRTLLEQSAKLNAVPTIVTFEPLAKEFFIPDSVVRLSSLEQKAQHLFELGIERVLCIDFTQDFTQYSPDQFIHEVLLDGLGTQFLSVGDDFRFGKNRTGDFSLLKTYGAEHGFSVKSHETFEIDGERVSSGRVRVALDNSDFQLAAELLGRAYTINGEVSKGQQMGRTIGFPTANIILPAVKFALQGVYVVSAELPDGEIVDGVANIGNRPTVDGKQHRLEVHLFDFSKDLYNQNLEVRFHHKIRDEQKFDSFDQLKKQIQQDADQARHYFLNLGK
jgi:riboflavin kinase/FMN adenylyltransferase